MPYVSTTSTMVLFQWLYIILLHVLKINHTLSVLWSNNLPTKFIRITEVKIPIYIYEFLKCTSGKIFPAATLNLPFWMCEFLEIWEPLVPGRAFTWLRIGQYIFWFRRKKGFFAFNTYCSFFAFNTYCTKKIPLSPNNLS